MLRDLAFALRQLRRTPGFAAVCVLTIALGIGANTAVFSVMNAVVLRRLPVSEPERLVFLHTSAQPPNTSQTGHSNASLSFPVVDQLRAQRAAFAELMLFVPLNIDRTAVRHGTDPETAWADMVSGNFFSGLGVRMAIGRGFSAEDEQRHSPIAILSYAYWTRRFARHADVIGQTLFIKGAPFTIIGVTEPRFIGVGYNNPTDIWIPIQDRAELKPWGRAPDSPDSFYGSPNWWFLMTIGRLAPGITEQQALAIAQPVFQRAASEGVTAPRGDGPIPDLLFTAPKGIRGLRETYQNPLRILMTMVLVVLLIACGNVSLLLAARNAARDREFSLRTALGGSRMRLLRQLLSESVLLVGAGTLLGWGLAIAATTWLAASSGLDVTLAPDRTVLGFTLAISVLVALMFGLAPLRGAMRASVAAVLKASAANITLDRAKLRTGQIVVASQIAMCFVLLVAAALLVRTLKNLDDTDLGMKATGLLVFGITPPQAVGGDAEVARFYHDLLGRLRALPGVESATVMSNRVGSGWSNNTSAVVDGKPPDPNRFSPLRWNAVGPDYFRVFETPLVLGRDFNDGDSAASAPVAIVNQTFVDRYLPQQHPLGHQVSLGSTSYSIVGVAADSRYTGVREAARPMAYFPYTQVAATSGMHVEVRAAGDARALWPDIRRVVRDLGPDLPLLQPMTQQEQFSASYANEQLFSKLAAFFGLLAAALVASGLYGTLTFRVGRRTSEIGVRMALGAERRHVLWMVLRESLGVSAVGVVLGVGLAAVATRTLQSTLFGVSPADPLSFALATAGVTVVVLGAGLVPARRASRVEPIVALRYE